MYWSFSVLKAIGPRPRTAVRPSTLNRSGGTASGRPSGVWALAPPRPTHFKRWLSGTIPPRSPRTVATAMPPPAFRRGTGLRGLATTGSADLRSPALAGGSAVRRPRTGRTRATRLTAKRPTTIPPRPRPAFPGAFVIGAARVLPPPVQRTPSRTERRAQDRDPRRGAGPQRACSERRRAAVRGIAHRGLHAHPDDAGHLRPLLPADVAPAEE